MIVSFNVRNLPDVARLTRWALAAHRIRLLMRGTGSVNNWRHDKRMRQGAMHPAVCGYILRPDGDRRGSFKHRLGYGCLFLTMRRHDPTAKLMRRTYVGACHTPEAHAGRGGVADQADDRQPQAKIDRSGSQRSREMLSKG